MIAYRDPSPPSNGTIIRYVGTGDGGTYGGYSSPGFVDVYRQAHPFTETEQLVHDFRKLLERWLQTYNLWANMSRAVRRVLRSPASGIVRGARRASASPVVLDGVAVDGDHVIAPFFHHPHAADIAGSLLALTTIMFLRVALYRLGIRQDIYARLVPLVALCAALDCTRNDLHFCEYVAFIAFGILSKLPWDRWRKQLGSKLSSMTAVAKAAFQRQQAEAFS